ncbi:MAG: sulfatase-like hydrolase/transferase [Chitinophagaceae bacterium]|nr:sulfatase-like hydrolase/transferase [Chitinophagaceae bacterium]
MTDTKKIFRIALLGFLILFLSLEEVLSQNRSSDSRPNILLIQTDDMGYDDISFNGRNDLETPHLDQLASQSIRFTDFTVASVCAPSRAMLLTGRHFLKTGVAGVHGGHDFVNLDETLLPELFKRAGYSTGLFGKWHSGKTDGYFPWDRGFDEAYMAKLYQYFPSEGRYNDSLIVQQRWSTEVITDYGIDFIKRHKDKPFFAYVSYFDPHGLWRAPEERVKKYLDKGLAKGYATLCAMMDWADENIGRLLKSLDEEGLADNTVVIFMSDNGPQRSDRILGVLTEDEWAQRNPSGFPGWKATNWANGIKSPLFFRWPGHYKPGYVQRLVDMTDILPTLMDIIGEHNYKTNKPLDGRSFKPYLSYDLQALPERKIYLAKWFVQVGDKKGESYLPISPDVRSQIKFDDQTLAIRNEHYALLMNPNHQPRPDIKGNYLLFDLKADSLQTVNLASEYPDKVDNMIKDLKGWYSDIVHNQKSFQAPWFQIGWKGKRVVEIPAYGTNQIYGGLINHDHFLGNWKNPGDKADYQLNVIQPGKYSIEIETTDSALAGMQFLVSYNGKSIKKVLANGTTHEIGKLNFGKGLGKFTIELLKNENGALITRMVEIKLTKI